MLFTEVVLFSIVAFETLIFTR